MKAQSKTLRILQEQKFERVGGTKTIHVDVRVIAATNKDLEEEIEKGTFRDDLYFRLHVIPIRVPSLKERIEDIPSLAKEFVSEFSLTTNIEAKEISAEAISILQRYDWPGNVRELKNLIERLMIMVPGKTIQVKDIPLPYNRASDMKAGVESSFVSDSLKEAKSQFEKAFIQAKLQQFNGNISQTAEAIGIERSNLHKKIKGYQLDTCRDEASS